MILNKPDEVIHREIDTAVVGIHSALRDLDNAIAKLTRRLEPYNAPLSTPHASTDQKLDMHANAAQPARSEFYERVAAFGDQIRARTEHIENLTRSLDI